MHLLQPCLRLPVVQQSELFVLCIRMQPSAILVTFCVALKPDLNVSYTETVIVMHTSESFCRHRRIFLSSWGSDSVHRSVITPSHQYGFYHKKLEPGNLGPWQRLYSTFSVRKVNFQHFFFRIECIPACPARCNSTEIINIIHFTSYVVT